MTHQAKRPYTGSQPSITSYFSSSNNQEQYLTSSPTTYTSNVPLLPPNVQSNLLQVGMRIRKSVPEGYKTGTPYSGFSLFADNNSPASPYLSNPSHTLANGSQAQTPEKPKPKTRPRAGARELTPFCGLLKVGGLASQQWGVYSPNYYNSANGADPYASEEAFADGEDGEMEDEGPALPWSSQGSVSTVSSSGTIDSGVATPSGGNKRRFFEDEGEGEDGGVVFGGRALGERVLAVPRRKKWVGSGKLGNGGGQENVGIVGEDVDFEDAEFLDYGLIGEVEMGGC
jgi:Ribonucleotide reductase inhibitor